jgi:hypothetical protein
MKTQRREERREEHAFAAREQIGLFNYPRAGKENVVPIPNREQSAADIGPSPQSGLNRYEPQAQTKRTWWRQERSIHAAAAR